MRSARIVSGMDYQHENSEHNETGASMVEYALLVVLIAIVALIAVALAGEELSSSFSDIASSLDAAN